MNHPTVKQAPRRILEAYWAEAFAKPLPDEAEDWGALINEAIKDQNKRLSRCPEAFKLSKQLQYIWDERVEALLPPLKPWEVMNTPTVLMYSRNFCIENKDAP